MPRLLATFFLLFALAGAALAADAPSDGPAVLVLDGSGSMWGNIGAEKPAKFDLARGALRQSLASLSPRVRLGLVSFGHRRRADCNDVEAIAAPEVGPPERILDLVDKVSPKGKGPLSLALREAARQIPAGEPGTVIAVHDGNDNCWQDPCAAARDIAAANAGLRIFLIGFGLEKAEVQRLQCVAEATNGRVLEAPGSVALAEAIGDALTLANLERAGPADGIAVPAPQPAVPPTPAGAPGVRLSASLSPGGPPLAAPVAWSLAKSSAPDTPVRTLRAKELSADLEPGSYVVEARFGQAARRETVEVGSAGPTVVQISLDAGYLKLNALADKSGAALRNPLITVSRKDGTGPPLWIGRDAAARLVLPSGVYRVRLQDGLAEDAHEVTVPAGGTAEAAPVLGTGQLELSAVLASGGAPVAAVTYVVEEDDPESPAGRREVARSAAPSATFTLPAGTYYVSTRSGAGEVRERIALGSGDVVKHAAALNLVPITISIVSAANAGPPDFGPSYPLLIRILSQGGTAQEITRAYGASATFQLPPARYLVEATATGLNVAARGIIDLSNGRGGTTQLKLEKGEISVLDTSAGATSSWRVKDGAGRTVMHSGPGRPTRAALAPGRYTLLSERDGARTEQVIDLAAGEQQTLSVAGP